MNITKIQHKSLTGMALEGSLITLSPLPLLIVFAGYDASPPFWCLFGGAVAAVFVIFCAMAFYRRPILGKWCASLAAVTLYIKA